MRSVAGSVDSSRRSSTWPSPLSVPPSDTANWRTWRSSIRASVAGFAGGGGALAGMDWVCAARCWACHMAADSGGGSTSAPLRPGSTASCCIPWRKAASPSEAAPGCGCASPARACCPAARPAWYCSIAWRNACTDSASARPGVREPRPPSCWRTAPASVPGPEPLRMMLIVDSSVHGAARGPGLQELRGGVLFLAQLGCMLLAAPDVAALDQRVLARLGAEELLARLAHGQFGLPQYFLGLGQFLLRALDLRAQQLDMGLALGKRQGPCGPGRRRLHQALALLRALHAKGHDLALDAQAGVALFAGRALA